MTRRTIIFTVVSIVLLGVAVLFSQAAEPNSAPTDADRITRLQSRIEKLEVRVAQLERMQGFAQGPAKRYPPQRGRREYFNDEPYYIIPLESEPRAELGHHTSPDAEARKSSR